SAAVLIGGLAAGLVALATGCSSGKPTTLSGGAGNIGSGGAAPGSGGEHGTGSAGNQGSGSAGNQTGGSGGSSAGVDGSGGVGGSGGARDASAGDGPADVPLPICNYPDWKAGTPYEMGDVVMYMAKPYVATNANNGLDPTVSTFFWSPYTGCTPMAPPPPEVCAVLDRLAPTGKTTFQATYDAMFAAPFQGRVIQAAYTYAGLCKALDTPALATFARSGNLLQDRREVAAFFANVAVETAYLAFVDEGNMPSSQQDYHGRGSLQITGQAIYQEVGSGLGLNLAAEPQLASTAGVVWQTGIWYWTLHTNPSVGMNCHQAIAAGAFGRTVRIIKGDCGSAADRVRQYQSNCQALGIDPGSVACP
ncbi:MAG TPA: glycoside hydrolase family 19 protein, partial [Polyangia bacterium]